MVNNCWSSVLTQWHRSIYVLIWLKDRQSWLLNNYHYRSAGWASKYTKWGKRKETSHWGSEDGRPNRRRAADPQNRNEAGNKPRASRLKNKNVYGIIAKFQENYWIHRSTDGWPHVDATRDRYQGNGSICPGYPPCINNTRGGGLALNLKNLNTSSFGVQHRIGKTQVKTRFSLAKKKRANFSVLRPTVTKCRSNPVFLHTEDEGPPPWSPVTSQTTWGHVQKNYNYL